MTRALAAAAAILASSPAGAQMIPRSVEIDGFLGYYSFLSRGGFSEDETVNLENLRDNASAGARFSIHFAEWIAFESSLRLVKTATWDTWRDTWYVAPDFDAVFHLPFPYVSPYFFAGIGFQHYNIRPTYARGFGPDILPRPVRDPYSDVVARPQDEKYLYRASDGDFTINAGGGAKFLIHERFGLRLDIRYVVSVGPGGPADGVPTLEPDPTWNDSFHHVDLSGGAFVLLGGGKGPDKDKDGIPNKIDKCVTEPEDRDSYEDEDGCPDVDNDQDGVTDDNDKCPNAAEDVDGFEDRDGCPDLDDDKDGIPDDKDECKGKPEDDDGFEDKDGCPELDNDGDGLVDSEDKCRNNPETFNFFIDEDGCPDQVPGDLLEFAGAIPAIQFEVASTKLLRTALPILDKAARAMLKYPDLNVEIAGHASSDGDDEQNMELSQGRTETVREHLIGKGVSSDRLTARGYGETMPVASNDTETGRRANRRVEFRFFGR